MTESDQKRFWDKVAVTPGCWLWTAGCDPGGYGRFSIGKSRPNSHRVAYELLVGPIPEGMELDHVKARGCNNRNCVNPAHLEPVTHAVNVRRGTAPAARNARATHCPHGHPYDGINTRVTPDGRRHCRACDRAYQARRRRSAD